MAEVKTATNGEQTASNEKSSAKKNAAKRSTVGSMNKNILSFIMRSAPYECDAIRVVITAMREKREMEQLSSSEATILNRYMNEGLAKDDNHSFRTVRKHRQKMAGQLLTPLSGFLEQKCDVAAASALLSDFANDDMFVDDALEAVKQDAHKPAASDDKPADKSVASDGKSVDKLLTSDGKSVDKPADNVRQGDKQSDNKPHANTQQSGHLFANQQ